jgi:DNA-binding NarL/FixJ family response regulator
MSRQDINERGYEEVALVLFSQRSVPMLNLLRLARSRGLASGYITTLPLLCPFLVPLAWWNEEQAEERQREVLLLLAVGASNDEIAEQLVIVVSTVKRHVSNILAKLTVSNRTQAVAHARELGLL